MVELVLLYFYKCIMRPYALFAVRESRHSLTHSLLASCDGNKPGGFGYPDLVQICLLYKTLRLVESLSSSDHALLAPELERFSNLASF